MSRRYLKEIYQRPLTLKRVDYDWKDDEVMWWHFVTLDESRDFFCLVLWWSSCRLTKTNNVSRAVLMSSRHYVKKTSRWCRNVVVLVTVVVLTNLFFRLILETCCRSRGSLAESGVWVCMSVTRLQWMKSSVFKRSLEETDCTSFLSCSS